MRKIFIFLIFLTGPLYAASDTLSIVFWNLENFYDYRNDSLSVWDEEFSSYGARHWTKERFYKKCSAVGKTLMAIADINGGMPDAAVFAELENAFVIRQIVNSTLLRKYGYSYIHYDSPDPRGIDLGLIYRKDKISIKSSSAMKIRNETPTRDILYCSIVSKQSDLQVELLCCHLPSKYGGEKQSFERRVSAAETVVRLCDSLKGRNIVLCGDFNDTPDSKAFESLDRIMVNKTDSLFRQGRGTIKFNGQWELIDMFYVSESLAHRSSYTICDLPFLLCRDSAHSGMKPYRTWSGPRYNGGVSDHLPVVLRLFL